MTEATPISPTVMVVDDSLLVRQQVSRLLTAANFTVITATDGQDALEKLATDAVSLIISDVNMPRMDGIEFLLALRAKNAKIAVLMLTTEGQEVLIRRAKEAGAVAWVVKPFKPELLVQAVKKLTQGAISLSLPSGAREVGLDP